MSQKHLNEEPNLLKSSKYKANRNGDNTQPCLTPKLISNRGPTDDHVLFHLTKL